MQAGSNHAEVVSQEDTRALLMVEHGPTFSRQGGLFFFRSKGGDLSVEYTKLPSWEQMVADYAAEQPYFADTNERPARPDGS